MPIARALDLRAQLGFYKNYHHNPVNVRIHCVCVPAILFTSLAMLQRVPIYGTFALAHAVVLVYGTFYILLNTTMGLTAVVLLAFAIRALDSSSLDRDFRVEVGLFCCGWIFQFLGHGLYEKKKPALLDNLVQSLVLAPFFVLYEIVFRLGFMADLRDELERDYEKKCNQKTTKGVK